MDWWYKEPVYQQPLYWSSTTRIFQFQHLGADSVSHRTSYHKILQSLEVMRSGVKMLVLLWNCQVSWKQCCWGKLQSNWKTLTSDLAFETLQVLPITLRCLMRYWITPQRGLKADTDLGPLWHMASFGVWQHQAITWSIVDLLSLGIPAAKLEKCCYFPLSKIHTGLSWTTWNIVY